MAKSRGILGDRVGNIRVLGTLGAGGMGDVYVGFDETLRRKVALKSIAGRYRLSPGARARFLREARLLSQLDHPGICRIYDYVDHGDREFLVLELIEGETLGEALQSGLTAAAKMRIARDIAAVLAVAHAEGIVHRDLKPDNVMVTRTGDIKVLDFGLARTVEEGSTASGQPAAPGPGAEAIADRTAVADTTMSTLPAGDEEVSSPHVSLRTEYGVLMGTPLFMSPEQARGEPATTASDMYSFGLLLQTVFTEELPYDADLPTRELLQRVARGDVLAASGMGRDEAALLGRLKSVPPAARPTAATTLERLQWIIDKPRRRVRRLIAAAVVLAATIGVVKYTVDLRRERGIADQRRGQAEELIDFMVGDLRGKLAPLGRLDILDDVGDRAQSYFAAVPSDELSAEELLHRSTMLNQIGGVRIDQGRLAEAGPAFEESLRLAQDLVARDPNETRFLGRLGEAHFWLGYQHWEQGDLDGSHRYYSDYLKSSERLVALEPESTTWQTELAYGHTNVGAVERRRGNLASAEASFRRSIEIMGALVEEDPANALLQNELGTFSSWLGSTLEEQGDLAGARAQFEEERRLRQAALDRDASDADSKMKLAYCLGYLGALSRDQGDVGLALKHLREQERLIEELADGDPSNLEWQRHLAAARSHLGRTLLAIGEKDEATVLLEEGLEVALALVRADTLNADWRLLRSALGTLTATAWFEQGKIQAAFTEAKSSLSGVMDLLSASSDPREALLTHARNQVLMGRIWSARGNGAEAERLWQSALARIEPVARPSNDRDLLAVWSSLLIYLGRFDEAGAVAESLWAQGYQEPSFLGLWELSSRDSR